MVELGTLEWAEITSGKMSTSDRLSQILKAIKAEILNASNIWAIKFGLSKTSVQKITFKEVSIPSSSIVKTATELCNKISPPVLVNHCLRTYAWGTLLGIRDGITYDRELFYLACLLHDLGLTETYSSKDKLSECFAVEGARAANNFLTENGYSADSSRKVAEAISLHLNVEVSLFLGKEAYLLHEGAALDTIGVRHHQLEKETVSEVLKAYPRLTLAQDLCNLLKEQAEVRPYSRANFLVKTLDLPGRVANSPFKEM